MQLSETLKNGNLLEVENLSVLLETKNGIARAVDQISFSVRPGETLGIVGESGCGKSLTSLAVMKLLAPNAKLEASRLNFNGKDLLKLSDRQYQNLRGADIAMIFQDPMTSLNPCFTVGDQVDEALRIHGDASIKDSKSLRRNRVIELFSEVGIPAPATRLSAYPHQLSGGMSQRVMIAMALTGSPKLLIADEPTTALDVTIQAQILKLLKKIQREKGMAMMLISHNFGVVAEMSDRIQVMYAGKIIESGSRDQILSHPHHPYTVGLLHSRPGLHRGEGLLPTIPGMVPDMLKRPTGCSFHPRCERSIKICSEITPKFEGGIACHHPI
jgi:dipeptide transport system ATP-binding protein